ncbi:MAG: type II toxin-antitoxin system VapC family toxin [Verrucomicrobiota bacterium]
MLVLDTDHLSELERDSAAGRRLAKRLETSRSAKVVTIVTLEELLRGWLAELGRHQNPHRQIIGYAKLQRQIETFANWVILPWDSDSAELFLKLRRGGVRIGSMDLKIACIVLTRDLTLLTRNEIHFAQVPGLRFEDWLD